MCDEEWDWGIYLPYPKGIEYFSTTNVHEESNKKDNPMNEQLQGLDMERDFHILNANNPTAVPRSSLGECLDELLWNLTVLYANIRSHTLLRTVRYSLNKQLEKHTVKDSKVFNNYDSYWYAWAVSIRSWTSGTDINQHFGWYAVTSAKIAL